MGSSSRIIPDIRGLASQGYQDAQPLVIIERREATPTSPPRGGSPMFAQWRNVGLGIHVSAAAQCGLISTL